MSTWLQRQLSSHQTQLVITAAVSGAIVAGAIFGTQALRRKVAIEDLKSSIPDLENDPGVEAVPDYSNLLSQRFSNKEDERAAVLARRAQTGDYDQELIQEQLTRTSSFLTPAGLSKLRDAFVIVIGLGGVGSHCTATLARSGVSHIRLVDFDQVTLSSLNRHSLATLADVGTPKVQCVRKRLEAVVPWVRWESFNEVWKKDQASRLLGPFGGLGDRKPDYIVDAIDNIDSKVALLHYCHENGLKIISSMGAGCKSDPTKIHIGDISTSLEDPLSRATRRRLKLLGVSEGIPVVFSIEKPGSGKAALLPLPEEEFQKGSIGELGVLPDFRARILPVLGTMPAVFGCVIANYIIMEISGYPHETSGAKMRDKLYDNVFTGLQGSEERLARADGEDTVGLRIPITKEDVGYLVDEIFRGKSVVSGLPTRLTLIRWKASESYEVDKRWKGQKSSTVRLSDLVCMTKEEAVRHEQAVLIPRKKPGDFYDAAVVDLVAQRLHEERVFDRFR